MMLYKVTSLLVFLGLSAWTVYDFNYGTLAGALSALVTFIGALYVEKKESTTLNQKVSENSTGYQAGGNMNFGSNLPISDKDDAE